MAKKFEYRAVCRLLGDHRWQALGSGNPLSNETPAKAHITKHKSRINYWNNRYNKTPEIWEYAIQKREINDWVNI